MLWKQMNHRLKVGPGDVISASISLIKTWSLTNFLGHDTAWGSIVYAA